MHGFGAVVRLWLTSSATTNGEKQGRQRDAQVLMLNLNSKIRHANGTVNKQIYAALDSNGIERASGKLRGSLHSVVIEKEIRIYEDERESFL